SRPVSLRQKETYPARRDTSNARFTIEGNSGGWLTCRVFHFDTVVSHREQPPISAATRCADVLPLHHHAERVRTHRAPRRGLTRGHLAAVVGVVRGFSSC